LIQITTRYQALYLCIILYIGRHSQRSMIDTTYIQPSLTSNSNNINTHRPTTSIRETRSRNLEI